MMSKIISSEQVISNTVKISCGTEVGTGFLISKDIIITAYHVLDDHFESSEPILIDTISYDRDSIVAYDIELDLCLVRIKESSENGLELHSNIPSFKQPCSIFGFPYLSDKTGDSFSGEIDKIETEQRWDFSFNCKDVDSNIDFGGLSGGAVISENKVIGIVLLQSGRSLRAISIRKAKTFLELNEINIHEEQAPHEIPDRLKQIVHQSSPNYAVFQDLTTKLSNEAGWFLTTGTPGSGKTTLIAGYKSNEQTKICGRYFIKIPEDTVSTSVRSSPRNFISWIEDSLRDLLGGYIDHESNFEKRIERIPDLLDLLSQSFPDKHCIFLIDGVDEIIDIQSFFSVLPLVFPKNISFILSTTSIEIIPSGIKAQLDDNHIIKVVPLDLNQCTAYLIEKFKGRDYKIVDIQMMAIKSEGHPLYLQYLSEYVLSYEVEPEHFSAWTQEIPTIGGEIVTYYESIWDKFFKDETKLWIVLTLSQLRSKIEEQYLIQMLPEQFRFSFLSNFQPISYLLNLDESYVEIYHTSFKNFIISKAALYNNSSNDLIDSFCQSNLNNRYSIENILYHKLKSSTPEKAVEFCSQNWADNCAINHVAPDLVIFDIRNVIRYVTELGSFNDLLRLLLLLERIEFRYDSVFAENATHLATALLSINEYEAALNYLIRENTLLVSDSDALQFLKLFYEKNALKEADILFEVMEARFRVFIHDEFNNVSSENPISLSPFVYRSNALTLSVKTKGNNQLLRSQSLISRLKEYQDKVHTNNGQEARNIIYKVREQASAWNFAYMIRTLNDSISSKEMEEKLGGKIDNEWARMKALSIHFFNGMNDSASEFIVKNQAYFDTIEDIEWLIKNYGYKEEYATYQILVEALIQDSKEFEIIETLLKKLLSKISNTSELRKQNGVDLDYNQIHSMYRKGKYLGYLNIEHEISVPTRYIRSTSWEKYYAEIIENIGILEGKVIRKRLTDNELSEELNSLKLLVKSTEIELSERARLDRSYLLIEDIYPFIFERVSELFLNYFRSDEEWFFDFVVNNSKKQFGIYSEGFRSTLGDTIQIYCKYGKYDHETEKLTDILREHIENYVENRWERTPELIKVVEFYGIINQLEKAKETYNSMLKTSMGPSWYKEAQLQLLNRTYRLNINSDQRKVYSQKFAGLLDAASGEMTFQRFIRQEKESFVGDLVSTNFHNQAIDYLKFETIPPAKILKQNAERNSLDQLEIGYSYENGARNMSIQSGVLQLIETSSNLSPYLRIALCDIFVINDDVFRFIDDFAYQYALGINKISNPDHRNQIYEYVSLVMTSEELEDEDRRNFSRSFISSLNTDLYNEFYDFAKNNLKSMKFPNPEDKEGNNDSYSVTKKGNCFSDLLNRDSESRLKNEDFINQGVESFEKENISIWYDNWSTESNEIRNRLKDLFTDSTQIVRSLTSPINKPDLSSWTLVDQLIWFSEGVLTSEETEMIFKEITNHFSLLVRPKQNYFEKYDWLMNISEGDIDIKILELIIWLTSHPLNWISSKADEMLRFLIKVDTNFVLPVFIQISQSTDPFSNGEYCSQLLLEVHSEIETKLVKLFEENPDLINQIASLQHFTIFNNYYELSKKLLEIGFAKLFEAITETIPEEIDYSGQVILDNHMLHPIDYEIGELNDSEILNGQFCKDILYLINSYCFPLQWQDFERSDLYLKRSYHENRSYNGRYPVLTNFALNIAIKQRISRKNIELVNQIINTY